MLVLATCGTEGRCSYPGLKGTRGDTGRGHTDSGFLAIAQRFSYCVGAAFVFLVVLSRRLCAFVGALRAALLLLHGL